jgi:hypothetical protein
VHEKQSARGSGKKKNTAAEEVEAAAAEDVEVARSGEIRS